MNPNELIDLVITGGVYRHAVEKGVIKNGDPLDYGKIATYTKEDVDRYLNEVGIPGVDIHIDQYRNSDGPRWECINGEYRAIFSERGIDNLEFKTHSEVEFKKMWAKWICQIILYPCSRQCR